MNSKSEEELLIELRKIQEEARKDLKDWQTYDRSMLENYKQIAGTVDTSDPKVSCRLMKVMCVISIVLTAINLTVYFLY